MAAKTVTKRTAIAGICSRNYAHYTLIKDVCNVIFYYTFYFVYFYCILYFIYISMIFLRYSSVSLCLFTTCTLVQGDN